MSYIVLARKYRPQTFADVIRQEHVTRTLTNAIHAGRVAHGILFSGPRGTGKTTIARILAKAMNCETGPTPTPCNACRSCTEITSGHSVDVFEIDGASNNGVDHIRDLRENIKYMPAHSRYKIYIIDEVHMLSVAAFNALLKTLEEPPAHIMFFFATTEFHKIPITILSRCQRHDLRRIELADIHRHMSDICAKEGIDIPAESLEVIARASGGSMRDGLSLLDQVMTCSEGAITHEAVLGLLGVTDRRTLLEISGAVFAQDVPRILDIIESLYRQGNPMKEFYAALLDHFRNLLMVKVAKESARLIDAPKAEIERMRQQVADISELQIAQLLNLLLKEESTIKFSSQPRYALEMIFIRMFQIKPALTIETLIQKMDGFSRRITEAPERFAAAPPPVANDDSATSAHPEKTKPPRDLQPPSKPAPASPPQPADNPVAREPQADWQAPPKVSAAPAETAVPSAASPEPPLAPPEETAPETAPAAAIPSFPEPPSDSVSSAQAEISEPVAAPETPAAAWRAIKKQSARISQAFSSYLDKSRLVTPTLDGDELHIEFQGNKVIFNQLKKHRESLRNICREVLGRDVTVIFSHEKGAENSRRTAMARTKQLEEEALNHPMVAAAMEIFNGKVIQVKPLQEE